MKNNKVSLYSKIAEILEKQIELNIIKEGEVIPSERQLCEIYNVSRMTVRLAISELVNKGLLSKVQGKGTFVKSKGITQKLGNIYSFSKEMEKQGKISKTKIINSGLMSGSIKVTNKLNLPEDSEYVFIERLRCDNKNALIIEKSYFPKAYKFLLDIDFNKKGLYKTLEEDYGIIINKVIEKFKSCQLNTSECKLLNLKDGHHGLKISRLSFHNNKIICYSKSVANGDVFEFELETNS